MTNPTIDHHNTSLHVPAVGITILIFKFNTEQPYQNNGNLLLSRRIRKHGNGQYGAPGGGLDHGETPPQAAHRETREETGLTITGLEFLCITNFILDGLHYVDLAFTAITNGTPENREPDKHEPWQWFSPDKLPEPLFTPTAKAIDSYRTRNMVNW